ncbi:MAG: DNA polymerase III subunit delta' [Pseudomonadota bacterium]
MSSDSLILDGAIHPARNVRLFGHVETTQFLAETYRAGHLHHALLLEGAEGIGKATLAFRFAYHMLTHPDAADAPLAIVDPDLDSPVLRQTASGASHNLLHLTRPVDPRSGRVKSAITVDEVRRAGHFLSQTSGTGNWRIVVIDPADDMNRSAANAILKILEEPPARTVFFVLSHAPGKLLPTIRSRCMPIRLSPLDPAAMKSGLEHLGLSDGQDQAVLDAVVAQAGGSLSNAILLLRYGGLEIAESVEGILKDGPDKSRQSVHSLADTLTARDREMAYRFFVEYISKWVSDRAMSAAADSDLTLAEDWARLSSEFENGFAVADGYNLDRKQLVLSTFSSLFRMPAA